MSFLFFRIDNTTTKKHDDDDNNSLGGDRQVFIQIKEPQECQMCTLVVVGVCSTFFFHFIPAIFIIIQYKKHFFVEMKRKTLTTVLGSAAAATVVVKSPGQKDLWSGPAKSFGPYTLGPLRPFVTRSRRHTKKEKFSPQKSFFVNLIISGDSCV